MPKCSLMYFAAFLVNMLNKIFLKTNIDFAKQLIFSYFGTKLSYQDKSL